MLPGDSAADCAHSPCIAEWCILPLLISFARRSVRLVPVSGAGCAPRPLHRGPVDLWDAPASASGAASSLAVNHSASSQGGMTWGKQNSFADASQQLNLAFDSGTSPVSQARAQKRFDTAGPLPTAPRAAAPALRSPCAEVGPQHALHPASPAAAPRSPGVPSRSVLWTRGRPAAKAARPDLRVDPPFARSTRRVPSSALWKPPRGELYRHGRGVPDHPRARDAGRDRPRHRQLDCGGETAARLCRHLDKGTTQERPPPERPIPPFRLRSGALR